MRTIIAGSRTITDPRYVEYAVEASKFEISELVSGTARGIDKFGEDFAFSRGIPIQRFKPDWDNIPKHIAGFLRNQEMAEYSEALILIWDGSSSGSADMLKRAQKLKLKIFCWDITTNIANFL